MELLRDFVDVVNSVGQFDLLIAIFTHTFLGVYLPYEISLPYEYVAPLFSTRKTVKVENRDEKLRNLLRFEIAKDKLTGKFNLRSEYYKVGRCLFYSLRFILTIFWE